MVIDRYVGVAIIIVVLGIHHVEHGYMDDGHGAAGAGWPELFAEHAILAGRNRRMVESGRVDGDLIPTMNGIRVVRRIQWRKSIRVDSFRVEKLAVEVQEIIGASLAR